MSAPLPKSLILALSSALLLSGVVGVALLPAPMGRLLASPFVAPSVPGAPALPHPEIARISAQQAKAMPQALFIDVRTASEFRTDHIPGAVSAPLETIDQSVGILPKDRPLILYCT